MKKLVFSILALTFLACSSDPPLQTINYANGTKHFEYTQRNGMLSGHFTCWYENGIKMVEGEFSNNQKEGLWQVWNTQGILIETRNYTNNYIFEITGPNSGTDGPIQYNYIEPGFLMQPFPNLKPDDIVSSKMLWRALYNNNVNSVLFRDGLLYNTIREKIKNNTVDTYADDLLKSKTDASKTAATDPGDIHAYHIKESYVFDKIRRIGEFRIIAIAPVVLKDGVEEELYWIRYDQLRQTLADTPLKSSALPSAIQNIEQLFFFRNYGSTIYKEDNIYGRKIADYSTPEQAAVEAMRIELSVIEMEVLMWVKPPNK